VHLHQKQAIPKCWKSKKRGRRPAWLSRDLLELRQKREAYGRWKQGQVTREDYRDAACHCREKICVAKARLEFKLASTQKENKKGFLKYVNSKRRIRDNIGPLLDEGVHLTETQTKRRHLMPSSPPSSTPVVGPGTPGALCWKTMTGGMIKSQPALNCLGLAAPAGCM